MSPTSCRATQGACPESSFYLEARNHNWQNGKRIRVGMEKGERVWKGGGGIENFIFHKETEAKSYFSTEALNTNYFCC